MDSTVSSKIRTIVIFINCIKFMVLKMNKPIFPDSVFCPGDHVSWHCALDNSDSQIKHMLIAEDPQLSVQETPFGRVQFVQIVGLTVDELKAAQHWNGLGVINIFKRYLE